MNAFELERLARISSNNRRLAELNVVQLVQLCQPTQPEPKKARAAPRQALPVKPRTPSKRQAKEKAVLAIQKTAVVEQAVAGVEIMPDVVGEEVPCALLQMFLKSCNAELAAHCVSICHAEDLSLSNLKDSSFSVKEFVATTFQLSKLGNIIDVHKAIENYRQGKSGVTTAKDDGDFMRRECRRTLRGRLYANGLLGQHSWKEVTNVIKYPKTTEA